MISNARRVVQMQPTTRAAPMSDQHPPVQVPIELIRKWCGIRENGPLPSVSLINAFRKAAQWGCDQHQSMNEAQLQEARDQQLDECCQWLEEKPGVFPGVWAAELRNALRPKVDDSETADAARMRWLLQGNGYFMEETGLCGHGPCDEQEMNDARREIDKRIIEDAVKPTRFPPGTEGRIVGSDDPRIWGPEPGVIRMPKTASLDDGGGAVGNGSAGAAGTAGQGFAGGGGVSAGDWAGHGGGGAGSAGQTAAGGSSSAAGGNGGAGVTSSINGSAVPRGGGGGGAGGI